MEKGQLKKFDIPDEPGVYFFRGKRREILYVGKATSLRSRVRSYFAKDLIDTRGIRIVSMVEEAKTLTWETTDSVLEALILEANYIKKYQPPYNVRDKDNKSFNYLVISEEEFPRILLVRGRELFQDWKEGDMRYLFGPFPQGGSLKTALKLVRKIFPYRDTCEACDDDTDCKPCFNKQIGLCPGPCDGSVTKRQYAQTVRHIALLFSGKKKKLLESLEKNMATLARREKFEEAAVVRKQIHALTHIRDVALIDDSFRESSGGPTHEDFRIEGYDVAHTSGTHPIGVMTVVSGTTTQPKEYRTFNIKTVKNNDTAALKEVLERRFAHPEWPFPRLIVIDGGKGQLRAAEEVLKRVGAHIPLVSVVKDEKHRPRQILGLPALTTLHEKAILLANSEAHRFSLAKHRKKRSGV